MTHRIISACLVLMVFSAFLVGQVLFEQLDSRATLSSQEGQLAQLYRKQLNLFRDRASDGRWIDLTKDRPPVVIINFWASWCAPCLEEFPSLVRLRKQYKPGEVFIVGVNSDAENVGKNMAKIYRKYHLNFPSVTDRQKWTEKFHINHLPMSIVYLGEQVVVSKGAQDFMDQQLLKKIDQALAK